MAKENSMPKCANVILLGMAAKYIEIVSPEQLRESIGRVFAAKGEKIVEMNQKAFDIASRHDQYGVYSICLQVRRF